jgi:hypothetical protein
MLELSSLLVPAAVALGTTLVTGLVKTLWTSRVETQHARARLTRALTDLEWEVDRYQSSCIEPSADGPSCGRLDVVQSAFLAALGDARSVLDQPAIDAAAATLDAFESLLYELSVSDPMQIIMGDRGDRRELTSAIANLHKALGNKAGEPIGHRAHRTRERLRSDKSAPALK